MAHGIVLTCMLLASLFIACGIVYPLVMSIVWLVRWRGVIPYKQFMSEI